MNLALTKSRLNEKIRLSDQKMILICISSEKTTAPYYPLLNMFYTGSREKIKKKDYAKMEKSFLIAIASMIGVSFASETPNFSMYIWRICFS